MKTSLLKTKRNRGIALLITVILVAFAALYFVTYLVLTANEYKNVARSQTWNDSLTVAEAGVEEGLALINKNAYDTVGVTNWWLTATSDGLVKPGHDNRRYKHVPGFFHHPNPP
jgi:hypothetical protein